MSTDARNHHYVPQTYLRAFTVGGSKKSTFTVFDVSTGKRFETVPRNVCASRDFNRVTVPGISPNLIETGMGEFESLIAPAVAEIESCNQFTGEAKNTILNLIALLAVRHPDRRESIRKFHAQTAEIAMGMILSRRDFYDRITNELKVEGKLNTESPSYQDVKAFFDNKEYDIKVSTERHLELEQLMHETALPLLYQRNWMLYRAPAEIGCFITSDNPVSLTWRNPAEIPLLMRNSPGFGMSDTELIFPLTKHLILIGTFDGKKGYQIAGQYLVAGANARTATSCSRQIYSPKRSFLVLDNHMQIVNGADLLATYGNNR